MIESPAVNQSPEPRRRFRSNEIICHINVAGFVSVMFALLLTFMVLQIPVHGGIPVDVAKVDHPRALRHADAEDALMIVITRDDKLFFQKQIVRAEQLPDLIRNAVLHGSEKKVYIRPDARAKYAWVKEILGQVQASGIENIAFITGSRTPTASRSLTVPLTFLKRMPREVTGAGRVTGVFRLRRNFAS
jgi:biopolymer transport protein ExbD